MKKIIACLTLSISAFSLAACGGSGSTSSTPPPTNVGGGGSGGGGGTSDTVGPASCVGGVAATFPCNGMKLSKRIGLSDFSAGSGNDIWGWTDPANGDEYALMGLDNGTAFVRITDPENPVIAGKLPTNTVSASWRDIKVYSNHAYIVADNAGAHGMQIFDLTRLRGVSNNQTFSADAVYEGVNSSHNMVINEDSGFGYIVGSNACSGGLHMLNLADPVDPVFEGCMSAQGYTHDAHCIMYSGPDTEHSGKEICFRSNEDSVSIGDVSDKSAPVTLGTEVYPNFGYTHQNWLDESQSFMFVGDELDERNIGNRTRTIVIDVRDLDNPTYLYDYLSPHNAIDHNMYVVGNRLYQANYHSGLQVLEFGDLATNTLNEVMSFDTYPADNERGFDGAWSVYPFFASGNIVISDIDRGLFIVAEE